MLHRMFNAHVLSPLERHTSRCEQLEQASVQIHTMTCAVVGFMSSHSFCEEAGVICKRQRLYAARTNKHAQDTCFLQSPALQLVKDDQIHVLGSDMPGHSGSSLSVRSNCRTDCRGPPPLLSCSVVATEVKLLATHAGTHGRRWRTRRRGATRNRC